jgi:hypothetical protein
MSKTAEQRYAEFKRNRLNAARQARIEMAKERMRKASAIKNSAISSSQTTVLDSPPQESPIAVSHVDSSSAEQASTISDGLYQGLGDEEFIIRQFKDFCGRSPSAGELNAHVGSLASMSRSAVNDRFAYCDEVVRRTWAHKSAPFDSRSTFSGFHGLRIAVLLTGHLRTFKQTYPVLRSQLITPASADVFVHTWDTLGIQRHDPIYGPIPDDTLKVDISEIYRLLPETVDVRVEGNAAFIACAKTRNSRPYVFGSGSGPNSKMLSAKPVLIESQLYGISSAFKLMEQHEIKNGFRYDLVIKLRSDMEVLDFFPDLANLSTKDLWVSSPPENNHNHPVCFACERGPHEGCHATDVCDTYAYGGREAMAHYCSLWDNLETVYARMCAENNVNIMDPTASHGLRDGHVVVPIWKNGASHRLHCFYPERILRLYLEGWHLKKGRVSCKVKR